MANEITFTGALSVYKPSVMASNIGRAFNNILATMTGNFIVEGQISVGTSATALYLGGITSPHWFAALNTDVTNYLRLMNGSGGATVVKLLPGECCIFPWDDAATPYAIAHTSACILEYLLISL